MASAIGAEALTKLRAFLVPIQGSRLSPSNQRLPVFTKNDYHLLSTFLKAIIGLLVVVHMKYAMKLTIPFALLCVCTPQTFCLSQSSSNLADVENGHVWVDLGLPSNSPAPS